MNMSWFALLLIGGTLLAAILVLALPLPRSRSHADRPRLIFREDDRYWLAGIFYVNPEDPAIFVPRRSGLGWAVNFGHPAGRRFVFAVLLLVLLCGVIIPLLFSALAPAGCHPSGCHLVP